MHNIAITGSFASGKSFVLKALASMGYEVFSCDEYVKKLYEDACVREEVEKSIEGMGEFNKQNLAKIIYNNKKARKILENIIHPKVRGAIKEFEIKNVEKDIVFSEVPLLFESGFDKYFSYNICVFCSEKTRFLRASSRGVFDPMIFEKIKQIQIPQEDKKNRSDFMVDSEEKKEIIEKKLKEIIKKII